MVGWPGPSPSGGDDAAGPAPRAVGSGTPAVPGGSAAPGSPSGASPAPGEATSATPVPTASGAAAARAAGRPLRVEVPSLGLDARVLPGRPTGGELDPPTATEAYWIEDYGTVGPASDNTAYIAGHSGARSPAVFNALFDRHRQVALVGAGDEIAVSTSAGRSRYVVTRVERYPKGELADSADVWEVAPGRLVLITCFQRADGRASRDNLVVFAELVTAT